MRTTTEVTTQEELLHLVERVALPNVDTNNDDLPPLRRRLLSRHVDARQDWCHDGANGSRWLHGPIESASRPTIGHMLLLSLAHSFGIRCPITWWRSMPPVQGRRYARSDQMGATCRIRCER
mmetsp:Transcript_20704/g.70069  ORF Transcript_20704/g.70069 Transcript_20704/m.70069 type:complete len:122 (-) Transcript_20704:8-373(-)